MTVTRWLPVLALLPLLNLSGALAQAVAQSPCNSAVQTSIENLLRSPAEKDELRRIGIVNRLPFFPIPRPFPCPVPPPTTDADIDPHRSLFVHDRATLDGADFTLGRTLGQIASQVVPVVPGTTPVSIFKQLWDTQNAAPGTTSGAHCTDNAGTVNGFPIQCPRAEGQQSAGTPTQVQIALDSYKVLALVNRLDLAHEGWRNCGEYRIIYGKPEPGFQRNLIIFEAVLPNPRPGCREGCVRVAQFWKSLSAIADPSARAAKLEQFFYSGLPGFRPVVHVDHYSSKGVTGAYGASGSGQIRTNQFLGFPWVLKEFKTVIDCGTTPCNFSITPIMVKVNPFGELWNEDVANAAGPRQLLAQNFQASVIANVSTLADAALMKIGYSVALDHDAGESVSLPPALIDQYLQQFNAATGATNTFRTAIAAGAGAHGLTADQIVNRALT
ncbi:MAG: hypothetical protein ABI612_23800, partial [Betaproteobacteria bacterium]